MSRPLLSFFLVTPVAAAILAVALGLVCIAADVMSPDTDPLVRAAQFAGVGPAPWAVVAFLVGAVAARSGGGVVTGMFWAVGALLLADGIYYLGHVYLDSRALSEVLVRSALVWAAVAVGAGVGFGAAGALWSNSTPSVAGVALALLGATLVVEAAYLAGPDLGALVGGAEDTAVDRGRALFGAVEIIAALGLILLAPRRGRLVFSVALVGATAVAFVLGPILMEVTSTAITAG